MLNCPTAEALVLYLVKESFLLDAFLALRLLTEEEEEARSGGTVFGTLST